MCRVTFYLVLPIFITWLIEQDETLEDKILKSRNNGLTHAVCGVLIAGRYFSPAVIFV